MVDKYLVIGYLGKVFSCKCENITKKVANQIFKEWRSGWIQQRNLGAYFETLLKNYGMKYTNIQEHIGFPGELAVAVKSLDQRLRSSVLSVATDKCLKEFISSLRAGNVDDAIFGIPDRIARYPYPIVDIVLRAKNRYEKAFAPRGFGQYLVQAVTFSLNRYYDINEKATNYNNWIANNIRQSTNIFLMRGGFYLVTYDPVLKILAKENGKNIVFVPGMPKDFNIINEILREIEVRQPNILKQHEFYIVFDTYDYTRNEIKTDTIWTKDKIKNAIEYSFERGAFEYYEYRKLKIVYLDKIKEYANILIYITLWDCAPNVRNVKVAAKLRDFEGFKYYDWRLNTDCRYFDTGSDEELFALTFIYAYKTLNMSFEDALKYAASAVYTKFKIEYQARDYDKVLSSLTNENIRKTMSEIFK